MKRPRPLTQGSVRARVERYLLRYPAPRAHARRLLLRQLERAVLRLAQAEPEAVSPSHAQLEAWLDEELDRQERMGILNDALYAEHKAKSLLRTGHGKRAISATLRNRGLGSAEVEQAIHVAAPEEDSELRAAAKLALSKRLGPCAREIPTDRMLARKQRDRDLARMLRRGFSTDVAIRVISAPTADAVRELAEGEA